MLIKTTNGWELPSKKVRYIRDGEQVEQVRGDEGEQWWLDFAEKWGGMDNVELVDLHYTPLQLARLNEIQDISGRYAEQCEAYVMDGVVPDIAPFAWKRTENDLLTTQEAAAYLYEQHLTTLDALAALYEQVIVGGEPK